MIISSAFAEFGVVTHYALLATLEITQLPAPPYLLHWGLTATSGLLFH